MLVLFIRSYTSYMIYIGNKSITI